MANQAARRRAVGCSLMQTTGQLTGNSYEAKTAAFREPRDESSQFYTLAVRKMWAGEKLRLKVLAARAARTEWVELTSALGTAEWEKFYAVILPLHLSCY